MGRITNPYVLTALACTGGLLFGFDISSMAGIIASPNYLTYFGPADQTVECPDRPGALCNPGPSADVQGGITALMAGGSFLASLFSGIVSDRFGRRYAIFLGCIFWVIGSILTCAVQNIAMLIVGRIFNGIEKDDWPQLAGHGYEQPRFERHQNCTTGRGPLFPRESSKEEQNNGGILGSPGLGPSNV
ncbi:uncharacterized protein UTRI_04704 [Ustilago trichophora]|uniref:Major facilitator superfamily (MFS) profile domain-containing protein n=1 Tax=Ustilago trichophora TaxID=86804 RepID=A0A5C3EF40_9BASI|nr:uncharacterized protein UTRI_04704 [Ustilago trichophora]